VAARLTASVTCRAKSDENLPGERSAPSAALTGAGSDNVGSTLQHGESRVYNDRYAHNDEDWYVTHQQ